MTCRIFICILLEWHSCNKEKKIMASSLIEIKVKNDKTKTNGFETIFNSKL